MMWLGDDEIVPYPHLVMGWLVCGIDSAGWRDFEESTGYVAPGYVGWLSCHDYQWLFGPRVFGRLSYSLAGADRYDRIRIHIPIVEIGVYNLIIFLGFDLGS